MAIFNMKTQISQEHLILSRSCFINSFKIILVVLIALPLMLLIRCKTNETPTMKKAAPAFRGWAPTPPMGWNSWDCYGPTVAEDEVKANAEYMAMHLKKFGWEYIVVDIRWYVANDKSGGYNEKDPVYNIDAYGRFLPAVNRFPSSVDGNGFKSLGDFIHSKGLKFGIHMMRGIPVLAVKNNTPILGSDAKAQDIYTTEGQCPWLKDMYTIVAGKPGAQEYYNSIFKLYASWGLDFVKVDDLSGRTDEIEMVRKAIDNCGRPIVISISPGGDRPETADFLKNNVNMWRTSNDFWDNWPALKNQFAILKSWAGLGVKGCYPDGDMLPLGKIGLRAERGKPRMTGFAKDEQYTLMTLFAVFRSPLMFGGDLPGNDEFTLSLITNKDVLNVNQNSINGKQLFRENDLIAWTADDPKTGDKYLALFNASDRQLFVDNKAALKSEQITPDTASISVKFEQIGLTGTHTIRNLWTGENLGNFTDSFTRTINRHGAGLYRIH